MFTYFMFSDCMCIHRTTLFLSIVIPEVRYPQANQNPVGICHKDTCLHSTQVPPSQRVEDLGTTFDASTNIEYRYDVHWRTVTLALCFPTVIEIQQTQNIITLEL